MAAPGKSRGRPLRATDKDLDEAAEITPEDIEAARAYWRSKAPPALRALLDAEGLEGDEARIFDERGNG